MTESHWGDLQVHLVISDTHFIAINQRPDQTTTDNVIPVKSVHVNTGYTSHSINGISQPVRTPDITLTNVTEINLTPFSIGMVK